MLYEQLYGKLYFELYGYIFALQLLVSLIFFVIYQPRRNYFILRACAGTAGYLLLVNFTWLIIRSIHGGTPNYSPVFYFLVTIYISAAVFFTFKTTILAAIYFGTGAYAVQHIAFNAGNIIKLATASSLPSWANIFLFDFLVYIIIGFIFFGTFVWPRRNKFVRDKYDIRALVISLCILVLCILLSYSSDSIFAEYIKDGLQLNKIRIYCSIYAVVGCVGALVIQFGFLRENNLSDEKAILDSMMRSEKKHHELTKETIAIINNKCHDLKHQLSLLEKLDDKEARKAYIEELSECIAFYDGAAETGNAALDIVISEKSLICEKNKISFTCLADGKKLDFMNSTDISSLFGNAFDNAIERQMTENEDRRSISLSVREDRGFIYVHMDNYCSRSPEFVNGLPQTTKENKEYHGFGTKSMQSVVNKYSGEMLMTAEEETFNLDILFPAAV